MPTKICNTCGKEKPLSEFSIATANSDGHECKCRECKSEYNREYHIQNRDRVNQHNREWRAKNKDKMREINRRNYREKKNRIKACVKARGEKHPERTAASARVNAAIKSGKLKRPDRCEQCGEPCRPDAHHRDYSKPLDVVWLCRSCHLLAHRIEGNVSVHENTI